MVKCPECGATYTGLSACIKFCVECGEPLQDMARVARELAIEMQAILDTETPSRRTLPATGPITQAMIDEVLR